MCCQNSQNYSPPLIKTIYVYLDIYEKYSVGCISGLWGMVQSGVVTIGWYGVGLTWLEHLIPNNCLAITTL